MNNTLEIQELLQHYQLPDVKAIGQNGDTLLHLVVKSKKFSSTKKIEILQILLEQGLDLNTKNNNGEIVLHLVIQNTARDIIDFLLTCNYPYKTNLQHSVTTCLKKPQISDIEIQQWESESIKFVEWIMSKNFEIGANTGWALSLAIEFDLQHLLSTLLKYTTYIDKDKNLLQQFLRQSAIHKERHKVKPSNVWYTSYFERYAKRFVNDLLDRGLSPDDLDESGISALILAIKLEEHLNIIKMLIDRSMNINQKNVSGDTAFYILIDTWMRSQKTNANYYREIALAMIEQGADINLWNNYKYSPLSNTILLNNLEVAKFLNECGVDFNVKTRSGRTLIHLLIERSSGGTFNVDAGIQLLNMLISKGCDVNAKDMYGLTALHLAARKGPLIIVQTLIEYKAHVNCSNNRGWRPLHYAAIQINPYVANLLLQSGAIINATNTDGNTPLHLAVMAEKDRKQTSLFKIFIQHGADLNEEFSTSSLTIRQRYTYDFEGDHIVPVTESYVEDKEEYLFKHWMKLKAANLKCVDNSGYEKHTHSEKYKELYKKYLIEIAKLKGNFIDGPVSLYNFINMNAYSRCAYINNEKLENIIGKQVTLEKNFPEYSIIILGKYREAVTKNSLMELAKEIWFESTNIVLPDLCLECIFSFI